MRDPEKYGWLHYVDKEPSLLRWLRRDWWVIVWALVAIGMLVVAWLTARRVP